MQNYFVMQLTDFDLAQRGRPMSEQRFEIQLLDSDGRAIVCGYVSNEEDALEINGQQIPKAVIAAAQRQPPGQGDYVDKNGHSTPFF